MTSAISNMWEKASTSYNRRISDEERAVRKFSLRRVSCKAHPRVLQILAELYYCADPTSYDDPASDKVVLCLESNPDIYNSVENQVLSAFDHDGEPLIEKGFEPIDRLLHLAEKALASIESLYTSATRIRVRTNGNGNVTYTTSEENELVFPLPQIPRSLSSLRPPIAQVTSLKYLGPACRYGILDGVDRVQWSGYEGIYAFKRAGRDASTTIAEIELLLQLSIQASDAARALQVSAVVLDARNHIRGFLSPFEKYGSLEEVFLGQQLHPGQEERIRDLGVVMFPRKLEWKEKLRWAAQLARGVAALHDGCPKVGSVTLRNLNPRNVLVSGNATSSSSMDTYLTIAGFRGAASPMGMRYIKRWAAPERTRRSTYEIGTALDVANLGMVLWALAEEKFTSGFPDIYSSNEPEVRRDSSASTSSRRGGPVQQGRSELWKKDDPPTPGWYRLLTESCVDEEPARRPKAAEAAATLERQLERTL